MPVNAPSWKERNAERDEDGRKTFLRNKGHIIFYLEEGGGGLQVSRCER